MSHLYHAQDPEGIPGRDDGVSSEFLLEGTLTAAARRFFIEEEMLLVGVISGLLLEGATLVGVDNLSDVSVTVTIRGVTDPVEEAAVLTLTG